MFGCPSAEMEHKHSRGFVWLSVAHGWGKGPSLDNAQRLGVEVRTFGSLDHRVANSSVLPDNSAQKDVGCPTAGWLRLRHILSKRASRCFTYRADFGVCWYSQNLRPGMVECGHRLSDFDFRNTSKRVLYFSWN